VNFLKYLNHEHANNPDPLTPNLVGIYNFYQKADYFFLTTLSSWPKHKQGKKKWGPKAN
jgi:hypothetical protein